MSIASKCQPLRVVFSIPEVDEAPLVSIATIKATPVSVNHRRRLVASGRRRSGFRLSQLDENSKAFTHFNDDLCAARGGAAPGLSGFRAQVSGSPADNSPRHRWKRRIVHHE